MTGRNHIDAKLTKMGEPVCWYAVKRVCIVNGVHHTNYVGFPDFRLEMRAIVRAS